MPDYSTVTAKHPTSAPRTWPLTLVHDDTTDRDAATPEQYAGAHAQAIGNEIIAISLDVRSASGLYVTDGGGLNIAYSAGRVRTNATTAPVDVAASTLALTDAATNYVECNAAGTVSKNTSAFTAGSFPMATAVCAAADISSITDDRSLNFLLNDGVYFLSAGTRDLSKLVFEATTELTIATGAVTATQSTHRIDTQADAASDDLDTINGGGDGMVIFVRAENAARTVVLKDGTGNLDLRGGDITLDDLDVFVLLYYDGTLAKWLLVARGGGGATQLSDLTDVGTVSYTAGRVLVADGVDYDSAVLEGTQIASTGETIGKVLRADGDNTCSWVAAGAGDMLKSTYDSDADGDVDPIAGGTGINSSASTGIPRVVAGTWTIQTTVGATYGGSGLNSSASTGVPQVVAGTWTVPAAVITTYGGTGEDFSASTGIMQLTAGVCSAGGTLAVGANPIKIGETTDPGAVANTGYLYVKDDGGDTELFYRDDSGNIVQITLDGSLGSASAAHTLDSAVHTDVAAITEAQGMIFYRGAATWDGLAVGTSGQVLTTGGVGANPSWTNPPLKALSDVSDGVTDSGATGDLMLRGAATYDRLATGVDGQVLKATGTTAAWEDDVFYIPYLIDGGGSVITTGIKGCIEVPGATILQASAFADQSGSIVIDLWKDTYANYPPTDADSITAAAPITITAATKSQDATLTGWTTALTAGNIIMVNVDSCATITWCLISLKCKKT